MAVQTSGPSLRSGFAWTFAGNAINGFSQWAILSLIAKLSTTEVLGQYALALAVATPVAMLAHLNLRSVLTTDVDERHSFADYFQVRQRIGLAGMAVTILLGLFYKPFWPVGITIILTGASLSIDNFEDLYHGLMQRTDRLDLVAKSVMLRSFLSIGFAALLLILYRSPVAVAAGLVLGRSLTFFLFDIRALRTNWGTLGAAGRVFRSALPLGMSLMLSSLANMIPRYTTEDKMGTVVLGTLVAINSFVTLGSVIMNALGQSATTKLARAHAARDYRAFRTLTLQLSGLAVGIGVFGALIAAAAGDFFLRLVYRPEFDQYKWLLVSMLLAGTLGYIASITGFVVTAAREFDAQLPLLMAVASTAWLVSVWAIPRYGLNGVVISLAASSGLQIAGNLLILRKAQ